MKKIFLLLFVALLGNLATAQITDYSVFDKKFNFYVANDLGRNGYYCRTNGSYGGKRRRPGIRTRHRRRTPL